MVFNSFEFIVFFIFANVVYRFLNHRAQNIFLLVASYVFYGSWDWRFLFLLLLSTVVDYGCALKISSLTEPHIRKRWLIISLCVNLGILGVFKYFNFFSESLFGLLQVFGVASAPWALHVILPVGVSFYTFQSISYMVDVYQKKVGAEKDFLTYALFVSFFPQLVAGPIERAEHMLRQYHQPRVISPQKEREGLWFITWGFFLKIFMADNLARIVGIVFDQKGLIPGVEVLLGSYAFAFQIFGDFAGYSLIAMGAARLLGFDLMNNFLFPYFVTNPRDFWREWHISLSAWLRDYVYIPLGGNRQGGFLTYRNLILTMFLGGLWHGAAWTFVIWGLYQGVLLCLHRLVVTNRRTGPPQTHGHYFWQGIKILGMFHLTCLGWLIFRADSLGQLEDLLRSLVFNAAQGSTKTLYLAGQIVFYTGLVILVQIIQKYRKDLMAVPNLRGVWPWVFFALMFYFGILWGEFGGQEFIYFQF